MNLMRNVSVAVVAMLIVGCSSMAASQGPSSQAAMSDEVSLAQSAANVLDNQMTVPPQKRIPSALINGAKCIAVFPSIVQAGFILAAKRGHGITSCRSESTGRWVDTAPAFYTLTGGSVGLQVGVQSSSVVLLFLDQNGVNQLLNGSFTLGTDITISAGPIGYNASIQGAPASVVSYTVSSKGLFAGVNLGGAKLAFARNSNQDVYPDEAVDPRTLLFQTHNAPSGIAVYNQALQQLAPANEERDLNTNAGNS